MKEKKNFILDLLKEELTTIKKLKKKEINISRKS